ncbi:DUF362 domain-containing protein [Candidatus Auribacterota bacterium]
MDVITIPFTSFKESVSAALEALQTKKILKQQTKFLLKPNLVNNSPPPITTPVDFTKAVIEYIRDFSNAEIVVGEGCGDPGIETQEVFRRLGYATLEKKYRGVTLLDLNNAPLKRLTDKSCSVFPEIYLPEIIFSHYLISLPTLKAHSLAIITGTLKNMIGVAPPKYYSGRFGIWRKSLFHQKMQTSIIELNKYRRPDLSLIDASIGLSEFHLGGKQCDPPLKTIVAGFDPVSVDRKGAELLGLNWKSIAHLCYEYS